MYNWLDVVVAEFIVDHVHFVQHQMVLFDARKAIRPAAPADDEVVLNCKYITYAHNAHTSRLVVADHKSVNHTHYVLFSMCLEVL